jgi:hypothetical protein
MARLQTSSEQSREKNNEHPAPLPLRDSIFIGFLPAEEHFKQ